jgi:hypothetical protein
MRRVFTIKSERISVNPLNIKIKNASRRISQKLKKCHLKGVFDGVQSADKNITIIHSTPVHQLTSGEDKSSNTSSIKTLLIKIQLHSRCDEPLPLTEHQDLTRVSGN